MRIVLLYAPPWKIARNGDPIYPPEEGPPDNVDPAAVTEGDFLQSPYGLLTLAAQALRCGFSVQTLNVSNFPWMNIENLVCHGISPVIADAVPKAVRSQKI